MSQDSTSERFREQRARAIEAAAAVFAHRGYHGASTADIAQAMGIKQGSLYYYFNSKEEALEEVCLLGLRDYVHRMELIVRNGQSFQARLLAVVQSHLSSYREKNEALKVYNNERLYLPKSRRHRLKQQGSHYREMLEGLFREAQHNGALRDNLDCHFAAQCVIGICNAMGELIVRDPQIDLFELTQKCTDLLLIGVNQTQAKGH